MWRSYETFNEMWLKLRGFALNKCSFVLQAYKRLCRVRARLNLALIKIVLRVTCYKWMYCAWRSQATNDSYKLLESFDKWLFRKRLIKTVFGDKIVHLVIAMKTFLFLLLLQSAIGIGALMSIWLLKIEFLQIKMLYYCHFTFLFCRRKSEDRVSTNRNS